MSSGWGARVSFGSGLFLLSGVLAITKDALANYITWKTLVIHRNE